MEEELDRALQVDVLIASLRMSQSQSRDLLEYLSNMLENALPAITSVKRGGWLLSAKKPVEELTVRFDDYHYQIARKKNGSFSAIQMKIVRGVVLKNSEIPVEQCIDEIVAGLAKFTEQNAEARMALNRFVTGG